ncbi:hypothetical protein LI064_02355 [Clostridium perfringens]|uniref:hypothetical protein n=1 Tax=Clostridium perfringens TaxID=1502 RepID=UPI00224639CA|nr:hypothetical protein [Clostridium perfringens]MCX0353364.1 hypothetical protein [Clostridium perfringens]MDM0609460.1 hypothetical protein [Clostridium perfringens]WVM60018.1 hypothetical protein V1657_11640 [Clostridium perfringens]
MIYVLKCPNCGDTELKKLKNKNMFKCAWCEKELHLTELKIEEATIDIQITDY